MNICIVNSLFPPHLSGTSRGVFLLSKELSSLGHEVIVITTKIKDSEELENHEGVAVYRLPCKKYPKLEISHNADLYYSFTPSNYKRIKEILKKHNVDIIHAYGQFFDLTVLVEFAAKSLNIPFVLTIGTRIEHTNKFYNFLLSSVNRVVLRALIKRSCGNLISLDKQMHDYIIKRYSFPQEKITYIPIAVDTDIIDRIKKNSKVRDNYGIGKEELMLSVGTISNLRNPLSLIKAIPDVIRDFPEAKFVFIGDVYTEAPVNLTAKLDLENNIKFFGRMEHDKIIELLKVTDIEGHDLEAGLGVGLASLESMASGIPTISSAKEDNFILPLLKNWENIVLVRPSDSNQISESIKKLFGDKKLRTKIGKNASDLIDKEFSLRIQGKRHQELYEIIIKN